MFFHNLQSIYRNFRNNKSTFFINLIGLSTGLTCAILIFTWVDNEFQIDRFHEKDTRLYQAMENNEVSGNIETISESAGLLARTLKEEFPEIEYAVSTTPPFWLSNSTIRQGQNTVSAGGIYAEKDYFNVFSYNLIKGEKDRVLENTNSIVISQELAKSLFNGVDDSFGKMVEFKSGETYNVSGVFEGTPKNSTLQFDFILPYEILLTNLSKFREWYNTGPTTYVVLKEGAEIDDVNSKISDFITKRTEDKTRTLFLSPYSDRYLYGQFENGVQKGGRIEYVNLFAIIAIFILLIACINFMNLSTAKASSKIREVGIKKAIGAPRKSLIYRYLGESIAITAVSLLIAILLSFLLLPQFNEITGKELTIDFNLNFIIFIVAALLFTGVVSGSYPALYLSGFDPISVLKGQLKTTTSELVIRKGLVFLQFMISIIFIISVIVVYKQIDLMQTKNLGYEKDNVVYFHSEGRIQESMETYLADLVARVPGVVNASSIRGNFLGNDGTTEDVSWEGMGLNENVKFSEKAINYDLIETLEIKMNSGRTFSRDFGANDKKIILNEAAIQAMRLKDPVGKVIRLYDENLEILGVTTNFHFESLHERVKPTLFVFAPEDANTVIIRIKKGEERETLDRINTLSKQYDPGFVMDYKFLDAEYQIQYVSEKRVGILSSYFSVLAIIISCLGLFGLASFTAERKRKEIGLRKALGASQLSIVYLLSLGFTKIVLVSIIVALPLSYFIMKNWLSGFAYRVDLQLWYFIIAGLIALIISWVVVGVQSYRASGIDPVECLRAE